MKSNMITIRPKGELLTFIKGELVQETDKHITIIKQRLDINGKLEPTYRESFLKTEYVIL